ncbi:Visinin [Porphyridium purpureum]|uniref:Visinin n=1 Tax=Porphyridium purpureum TaxID=35688 RepID=A0A5J4YXI7_PORPP|nr:Visinin [Porphyridium purpureum]|eukprot:POR9651..scf209_3
MADQRGNQHPNQGYPAYPGYPRPSAEYPPQTPGGQGHVINPWLQQSQIHYGVGSPDAAGRPPAPQGGTAPTPMPHHVTPAPSSVSIPHHDKAGWQQQVTYGYTPYQSSAAPVPQQAYSTPQQGVPVHPGVVPGYYVPPGPPMHITGSRSMAWEPPEGATPAQRAQHAFRSFDRSQTGFLDLSEFLAALQLLHVNMSMVDAQVVFSIVDEDHNGRISEQEFVAYYQANFARAPSETNAPSAPLAVQSVNSCAYPAPPPGYPTSGTGRSVGNDEDKRRAAEAAFVRNDHSRSGYLDEAEFGGAVRALGVKLSASDVRALYCALVSESQTGKLGKEEFVRHYVANY